MSEGSSDTVQIAERLRQAQELISEVIALLRDNKAPAPAPKPKKAIWETRATHPDFSMPIRPFVKKNAVGMNGTRKFTLIVAYLALGDEQKAVALSDVESHWNKMTDKNLLGMKFNRLYTSEAKNEDWVHSPAKGVYHLRPAWKAIFE